MDLRSLLKEPTFEDEMALWHVIIKEMKLNVSLGSSFHCVEPGWFRVCFANMDDATVEVALRRIQTFVARTKKEEAPLKKKSHGRRSFNLASRCKYIMMVSYLEQTQHSEPLDVDVEAQRAATPNLVSSIDMIISLYENNLPMRFGVILFSKKFIKMIEMNDGKIPAAPMSNDDVSSLKSTIIERGEIGIRVASLNSSQNCPRLSSILLVIWQINKLRIESADPTEDAPEMHHVEGAFVETLLELMFVFKLGLVKLQCCLLMNGLVVDANEISVSMSYMLLQEIWVLKLDSS
ncbi:hypothetical protein TEA_002654 [Camellia sinensis var. sinensis]|uniref:1-aminocyclopropane-1-carboxylate synthase n=1 Tax=Camellia sinensis var. sinensis TaxID=542762 RepID=A0A4S4CXC4_CAMSN|nr:hypothetical protein TEA_002654 [Camellia sinensis var. sinensis]